MTQWIDTLTDEDREKLASPSTKMALALGRVKRAGEVYGGTVYGAEKAKRREVGRRQRAARKLHRRNRAAGGAR